MICSFPLISRFMYDRSRLKGLELGRTLDDCVSELSERNLPAIYQQWLNICGFSTIENMRGNIQTEEGSLIKNQHGKS
jgi:hypothetical protein